jgi:hypothetical protein
MLMLEAESGMGVCKFDAEADVEATGWWCKLGDEERFDVDAAAGPRYAWGAESDWKRARAVSQSSLRKYKGFKSSVR